MISKRRVSSMLVLVVLGLMASASTMAQVSTETGASSVHISERPDWGGSDGVLYAIGYSEFMPPNSTASYATAFTAGGIYSTVGGGSFYATPHLPSGVLLTYLELDYCDTAGPNVTLNLYDCSFLGDDCSTIGSQLNSGVGLSGCSVVSANLTPVGYVTNNFSRRLVLVAVTDSGTFANQLVGAYIGYKLQVSPAPMSATFLDVPTNHPYFRFVEALADAGITGGCGGNSYCVNDPITRGEMAVFLSVALGLHFPN